MTGEIVGSGDHTAIGLIALMPSETLAARPSPGIPSHLNSNVQRSFFGRDIAQGASGADLPLHPAATHVLLGRGRHWVGGTLLIGVIGALPPTFRLGRFERHSAITDTGPGNHVRLSMFTWGEVEHRQMTTAGLRRHLFAVVLAA